MSNAVVRQPTRGQVLGVGAEPAADDHRAAPLATGVTEPLGQERVRLGAVPGQRRPRRARRPTRARRTSGSDRRRPPPRCRARRRARPTAGPAHGCRRPHGLLLLGGQRLVAGPAADALGVAARLAAAVDRGHHHAVAGVVEQRDRPGQPAADVAERVVAHDARGAGSAPAASARSAATSCRSPTTSSGSASGSPAYDGVRRQASRGDGQCGQRDHEAEHRQDLHPLDTKLPR